MSPDDFEFIARLVRERAGLVLTRDKGYLVENRLLPLVRKHGFKSMDDLSAALRKGDATLHAATIDAMLAKDTGFFRDWAPFEHFRTVVLPNLIAARSAKKTFRILSAASSTGQEIYSIAMLIQEAAEKLHDWRFEIMGIDLSASALVAAERGLYSQFDVQRGLPIRRLLQHFTKAGENWQINENIRALVKFQPWNLQSDLYPLGRFDVVLCRNVMVYFEQQAKFELLQKLARLLVEDGVLYLGIDETVAGVSASFRAVAPEDGVYAAHRADKPASFSLAVKR